jgi:hypothetical protein
VIDEQRATLYLGAAVMRATGPRQEIFALSLADGSIEPGPSMSQQRSTPTSLT